MMLNLQAYIGAVSLFAASAQEPQRTLVREDSAHCQRTKSQVR